MTKSWTNLKKIAGTVHDEIQKEVNRIVGRYYAEKGSTGNFDLESFELSIRSLMHGIGCSMLEMLVNADGGDYRGNIFCAEGQTYKFIDYRDKKLLTVLGWVTV